MDHLGGARRRLSAAAVLWSLQFLSGVAGAPAYALLAVYVEASLHASPLFTASLRSLQLALGGLSAPVAGALADRLGYKPAYLWGMTSTVAACAVFLTGQPLLLALLFVYSGMLGSLQTTAGQAYLMEATRRSRLGMASAGYFLGGTLGTALGSAGAGYLLHRRRGFDLLRVGAHLSLPSNVASGPGFRFLGALTSGLALALIAGGLLLPDLKRGSARVRPAVLSWSGMVEMLGRREVRLLLGIRFLPTCYWGAVTLLIPLMLFRLTGSEASAGEYAGASLILASLCQFMTGRICDRKNVRYPVLITPIGITASAVGLTLGAQSVAALWGFGILGACSAWSLSTTMPLLIEAAARPEEKGRLVGLTALAWNAGMLSGNEIAGMLSGHPTSGKLTGSLLAVQSPGLPFALAALCGLGTICLAFAICRESDRRGMKLHHRDTETQRLGDEEARG